MDGLFTRALYQTADMIEQHRLRNEVADLVDQDQLRTTATNTLTPISAKNLRKTHELIESGRTVGKLVLTGWA